ncbi:MAG: LacI family transcriptional regulator [Bryobacterales bacterium]|nr:LacI family transcriptional regulator [Bryobacterales bacterium]
MKDLARELGVSVVTISKVLRNHRDISTATRERVLKRMKELNYRPNLTARALITGRTQSIGLIVPDLVHTFFGQVAKGINRVLRQHRYSLVISSSEEDADLERQEIDEMLARRVDALIIASTQWSVESFRRIEEHETPYILVDRKFVGLSANFVGVDDEVAGFLATGHLIEQGCKRIAHIRGGEISTAAGRHEGYRRALVVHGMVAPSGYVVSVKSGDDAADVSGYEAMKELLRLNPPPDGVFCYNDPTGTGAIRAAFEAGLRVPRDVAIIGCGNVRFSEDLRVPLSSVDQDCTTIGAHAAGRALELIESKTPSRPETILLKPRLVVRQSSRRTG